MTQVTSTGPRPVQSQRPAVNQAQTIDLLDLANVLWSKVLYIVVAALLVGVLMLGYSVFMVTPKYTSTTTMYVNTGNVSLGSLTATISTTELSTSEKLVDLYITILNSRETLDEVVQEAGLSYSYDDMRKLVSAEAGTASGVFSVSVEDANPEEAELIANTIASVLPVRISDIVDGTSTRVIEYAVVASQSSSPSYTKNLAIGILVGAVLSVGVLTVLYLLDTSRDTLIHSTDDLAELYPELPVLATIMDMRITKSKEYTYNSYQSYYAANPAKPKEEKKSRKKSKAKPKIKAEEKKTEQTNTAEDSTPKDEKGA